jgi:hypothetical protein
MPDRYWFGVSICCYEGKSPCRMYVGVDSETKFFREELLNWKSKRLAS